MGRVEEKTPRPRGGPAMGRLRNGPSRFAGKKVKKAMRGRGHPRESRGRYPWWSLVVVWSVFERAGFAVVGELCTAQGGGLGRAVGEPRRFRGFREKAAFYRGCY